MSRKAKPLKVAQSDDPFDIPKFLRVPKGTVRPSTPPVSTTGGVEEKRPANANGYVVVTGVNKDGSLIVEPATASFAPGAVKETSLKDAGTVRLLREAFQAREERLLAREERKNDEEIKRARRIERERNNPLRGKVPLKEILRQMGSFAPKRRHAIAAIDASKEIHMQYHFEPGEATIARIKVLLSSYSPPPRKAGGAAANAALFDPKHVIVVKVKKNPRREGSGAHDRMAKLISFNGKTVGEFLGDRGNPTTLKNAVAKKWVEVKEGKHGSTKKDEGRDGSNELPRKEGDGVRGEAKKSTKVARGKRAGRKAARRRKR